MIGDDVICGRPGQHHLDDVAWATRQTDPCDEASSDADGVCSEPPHRTRCCGHESVRHQRTGSPVNRSLTTQSIAAAACTSCFTIQNLHLAY
jgi:hypothetical protein